MSTWIEAALAGIAATIADHAEGFTWNWLAAVLLVALALILARESHCG